MIYLLEIEGDVSADNSRLVFRSTISRSEDDGATWTSLTNYIDRFPVTTLDGQIMDGLRRRALDYANADANRIDQVDLQTRVDTIVAALDGVTREF